MNIHHLRLHPEPFRLVVDGKKTIESRLNDEKRQTIRIGDKIIFVNRSNENEQLEVRVKLLHNSRLFSELFRIEKLKGKFGIESIHRLEKDIAQYYTTNDQEEYGVVGIEFESVNDRYTYSDGRAAERAGKLHEWVIEFLNGSGDNPSLAHTLQQPGLYSYGPIDYDITSIKPILGTDHTFKFYEEKSLYDARVDAMVESYGNGWKPVPLIASNIWEDEFTLADGAHRHGALLRLGIDTYPTIFYFKDKISYDAFVNQQNTMEKI